MNESLIFGIIIGGVVASIFWFFTKRKSGTIDNTAILEKDTTIAGLTKEKDGLKKLYDETKDSLEKERTRAEKQLMTIDKIDEHKKEINTYRTSTEERNRLDKKDIDQMKNYLENLTGSSRFQGNIGEKILENILNLCGLQSPGDFTLQDGDMVVDPNDTERLIRVRPDTCIKLGKSDLVVDSKVSLDNWKDWLNEKKDEKLKKSHLKKHLDAINKHIDKLSTTDYTKKLKKKAFPTTIMFIAFETGYFAALEADPELGEKAYRKNVILAGPGNIMAIIKIVETIKSKEKQIESVSKITKSASSLIDKYAVLKKYLKTLVSSYRTHGTNLQSVINSGWAGKDSLEKQMIDLKEKHGLHGTKNIEQTLDKEDKVRDIEDPEEEEKNKLTNHKHVN